MVTVNLTHDCVSKIIIDDLVESYRANKSEIATVKAIKNPPPYRLEDMMHSKKMCKALKKVIRYYTTQLEFDRLNL